VCEHLVAELVLVEVADKAEEADLVVDNQDGLSQGQWEILTIW
jgi:hypothetical protein